MQEKTDQDDLSKLFAKVDKSKVMDDKQEENSDTNEATNCRQTLAEFIVEASSSVDMSNLVNDNPWLLEVNKFAQFAATDDDWQEVLLDTGAISSTIAISSAQTPAGSGSGIAQEDPHIMEYSIEQLEELRQLYADAKQTQSETFSFDGYDLHVEYARWMIDQMTGACDVGWRAEETDINATSTELGVHLKLDGDEAAEDALLASASTRDSSRRASHQRLPWAFCIAGMLLAVTMFMIVAFYTRHQAYEIINEDKRLILCQNQNFAQVVTEWMVQDLIDTVQRSAELVAAGAATADFSSSQIGGSFPAVMMGVMNSGDGTVLCVWLSLYSFISYTHCCCFEITCCFTGILDHLIQLMPLHQTENT